MDFARASCSSLEGPISNSMVFSSCRILQRVLVAFGLSSLAYSLGLPLRKSSTLIKRQPSLGGVVFGVGPLSSQVKGKLAVLVVHGDILWLGTWKK